MKSHMLAKPAILFCLTATLFSVTDSLVDVFVPVEEYQRLERTCDYILRMSQHCYCAIAAVSVLYIHAHKFSVSHNYKCI